MGIKIRNNSWGILPAEIFSRLVNAIFSIKFSIAFFFGLLFFGGIGVWLPYWNSSDPEKTLWLSQNLFTYSMAILSTLLIEFVLKKSSVTDDLSLLALGLGMVSATLCVLGYADTPDGYSQNTLIGAALAVVLFLFVNVNDEKYDTQVKPAKATATGYSDANVNKINDK